MSIYGYMEESFDILDELDEELDLELDSEDDDILGIEEEDICDGCPVVKAGCAGIACLSVNTFGDAYDLSGYPIEFSNQNEELAEASVGVQTNDANIEVPQLGDEDITTMVVNTVITPEVVKVVSPAKFEKVTIEFTSLQEYHDVVAALTAYSRKLAVVSGTSIAADKGLSAYSGNARKTVNQLINRLP